MQRLAHDGELPEVRQHGKFRYDRAHDLGPFGAYVPAAPGVPSLPNRERVIGAFSEGACAGLMKRAIAQVNQLARWGVIASPPLLRLI